MGGRSVDDVVAPRNPYATVYVDSVEYPALVLEWDRRVDANGYPSWYATCLYWREDEAKVELLPEVCVFEADVGR